MINQTVSHELRNPLNSISEQLQKVRSILAILLMIVNELKKNKMYEEVTRKLSKVYNQLNNCQQKMNSATMFVEFFVNDMLDYAVLQNSEQGFIKDMSCFDIREAI